MHESLIAYIKNHSATPLAEIDIEAIKDITPGYLLIFIQGALNMCYARDINLYAIVNPRLAGKYDIGDRNVELVDLLELARDAVQRAGM